MEEINGRIMRNRWHRPRSKKYMTVELERPFVWPEEPEDMSPWNQEQMEASQKMQEERSERDGTRKDLFVNEDRRKSMREQAKALLEGKVKWKPNASSATMLAR